MRKLLSLIMGVLAITSHARQISSEEAAVIAAEFLNSKLLQQTTGGVTVRHAPALDKQQLAPYYVFNADSGHGFVIVAGDDRVPCILGYSDVGLFDFTNIPPQLATMLESYSKQIESLSGQDSHCSWSKSAFRSAGDDGILLRTANWGQGYPYNIMTPVIDGEHCPTGCANTAMAIIMKYYNYPRHGITSQLFYDGQNQKEYTIDFESTELEWDNMPDQYSGIEINDSQVKSIATLMHLLGVSTGTIYQLEKSSTTTPQILIALKHYFNFATDVELHQRRNYDSDMWFDMIYNEIANDRPLIYMGFGSEGHAFVVDGVKSGNMLHINWGWDGVANGYYDLDGLCPLDHNFSVNQSAVFGLMPRNEDDDLWSDWLLWYDDPDLGYDSSNACNDFLTSVQSIIPNEAFHIVTPQLIHPTGQEYAFGIALVNNELNVKEILNESTINTIHGGGIGIINGCFLECLLKDSEVAPDDYLYLFTREKDSADIKLIRSSDKFPSFCAVDNLHGDFCNLHWDIDSRLCIGDPMRQPSAESLSSDEFGKLPSEVLKGTQVYLGLTKENAGHAEYGAIVINDKLFSRGSKYWNPGGWTVFTDDEYFINCLLHSPEEDQELKIDCNNPGYLNEFIAANQNFHVADLSITGSAFAHELSAIRNNYYFLKSLDLSALEICDTSDSSSLSIPNFCFGELHDLTSITLPENIYSIGIGAFGNTGLKYISLPSTLCFIDRGAFFTIQEEPVTAICCKADTPPAASSENIFNNPDKSTLYVPFGKGDLYRNASTWKDFGEIIEGYAEGFVLSETELTGHIGDDIQLSADFNPSSTPNKKLLWSSLDDSIVRVDENGLLHLIGQGTTEIRAFTTDGTNLSATCSITVLPVMINSITIVPEVWSGEVGETCQLSATVLPENASEKLLTWSSSNETVATVDNHGLLTIIKEGACVITAEANDGSGMKAQCTVTGLSGISALFADSNSLADVYSIDGKLIMRDCNRDHLPQLPPGAYILRQGDHIVKLIAR